MLLLALDLATVTGWAFGPAGQRPRSGVLDLGRDSHASRASKLFDYVHDKLALGTAAVGFEQVLHWAKRGRAERTELALKLAGAVELAVQAMPAPRARVVPLNVLSVTKFWTGRGRYLNRGERKRAMIRACEWRGFQPADDNEADAIGLWHALENELVPQHGAMRALDLMKPRRAEAGP